MELKKLHLRLEKDFHRLLLHLKQILKDVTTVKNDVRNAVNRVKSFPEEVTDLPAVVDFNVSDFPVITVNIDSTSGNFDQARQITDELQVSLSRIKGVACS